MPPQSPIHILGAGPGGAYTALALAKMGIPSTLIDRATFPRTKACGDILTSNVIRALHALDPEILADLLTQPWVMPIEATAFVSHKGQRLFMPFHSPANAQLGIPSCLSARRRDFDAFLLSYVQRSPLIQFHGNTPIHGIRRQGTYWQLLDTDSQPFLETSYLVLATGAGSKLVTQALGTSKAAPKHTAVGLRAYYTATRPLEQSHTAEFFLFDPRHMPGGLYVTPFSDQGANVNLVMRQDVFQRDRRPLRNVLDDYLQAQPLLKPRFEGAILQGQPEGSLLHFGTARRPLSTEGLLLVGDAGGLTDATNANGIGHAMISGGIAADFLAQALTTRGAIQWQQYDRQVYARLQNALFPGKLMNLLFSNRLTSRMSAGALNLAFRRLNSQAVSELVYSKKTSRTLLSPAFYVRLFSKAR